MEQLTKEVERRNAQVAHQAAEVARQTASIRDLQAQLKKAKESPQSSAVPQKQVGRNS